MLDGYCGRFFAKKELGKSVRGEFVNWQENLERLWKGGEINHEVYWQFQKG